METGAIKDGLASLAEYGMASLLIVFFLIVIWVSLLLNPLFQKTLYLPANDFPLKGIYYPSAFYNYSNSVNAMFYSEQQSNGTGCIDEVTINSTKIITYPSQVENTYYNYTNFESSNGLYVNIPFGDSLLCQSIRNNSS